MFAGLPDKIETPQPRWLYEASPFIYIAAGLVLAFVADEAFARLAGTLLLLYGLRIAHLRWTHRRPRHLGRTLDSARKALCWDDSLACENASIDAEHRELFAACHQLLSVANEGQAETLDPLIRELIRKIEGHYHREEKLLHELCPTRANLHQCAHHELSARTHALYSDYIDGRTGHHQLIDHLVHEAVVGDTRQTRRALGKRLPELP